MLLLHELNVMQQMEQKSSQWSIQNRQNKQQC